MEFIDSHQHLIYRQQFGYGWTAGIEALEKGDFTLEAYNSLVEGLGVAGSIFMETGVDDADYQNEARFVAGLIGKSGLLAQIASCRPEVNDGFDAWLEECQQLSVVGFRRILHVMPDELSQSSTFRSNVGKIGKAGLPFDVCVLSRQLPLARELAKACSGMPLVLNHCGVPAIAEDAFDSWASNMSKLAEFEHVRVKLSGITAYCAPGPKNYTETLRPWFDHVVQSFGPERMLWGGDWPVVNLGAGLSDWIAVSRELLEALSPDEQAAIAYGNAKSLYGV